MTLPRVSGHAETKWLVLLPRPASRTLALADSLTEAGIPAWAPREAVHLRARRGHKPEVIAGPLMPGYVFAASSAREELLALSHSPSLQYQVWDPELRRMVTKGHPFFTLFRPFGEIESVTEAQLKHLRKLDGLRRPKSAVRVWETGDRFRMVDGAYAGLSGSVLEVVGKSARIAIEGWSFNPVVPTWLFHPPLDEGHGVKVNTAPTERPTTAKAA